MVKIRTSEYKDIQIITDFQIKMALETENLQLNKNTVNSGVISVFENTSKGKYYIAEFDNQIVGCLLTTYEWSDWRNKTILWIQSVYIIPEFRKKGIFKELYFHVQKLVLENEKYCGIKLYVDKTNIAAQNVYKNVGMNGEHYQTFEWMKE